MNDVMFGGFLPTAESDLDNNTCFPLIQIAVAINNRCCRVWHENSLAAEANEAEGPDADGLHPLHPTGDLMVGDPDTQTPADWTTLFGQVVLIHVHTEATWPRRGGSGVPSGWRRRWEVGGGGASFFRTVPAEPPAGPGGGPRLRTPRLRVCTSSWTHARRCLICTFGAP